METNLSQAFLLGVLGFMWDIKDVVVGTKKERIYVLCGESASALHKMRRLFLL